MLTEENLYYGDNKPPETCRDLQITLNNLLSSTWSLEILLFPAPVTMIETFRKVCKCWNNYFHKVLKWKENFTVDVSVVALCTLTGFGNNAGILLVWKKVGYRGGQWEYVGLSKYGFKKKLEKKWGITNGWQIPFMTKYLVRHQCFSDSQVKEINKQF